MKKRTFQFLLLIFTSTVFFTACNDSDDSLGNFRVEMATVRELDNGAYYLVRDADSAKLWIAAPLNPAKPSTRRVIANYTTLSDKQGDYDHYIKLNWIESILTKPVIYIPSDNEAKQDSIGNDAIKVLRIWEGGGYLNIYFGYNFGEQEKHMVNMVTSAENIDLSASPVELEFRHNKYSDPEAYPVQGYVSFDLAPYKAAAKAAGLDKVNFKVNALDFDGQAKTYDIEYKIE